MIKVVRLISGEELMGSISDLPDGSGLHIKNVCQIVASYSDTTTATARVGLSPFMPYTQSSDGIDLKSHYIGFIVDPVNELTNEYNQVFGSGLVLPPSKPSLQTASPTGSSSHAFVKMP
tara:strand:- start:2256 stop:2612 length:357 start_codon:yes stop_codon:yes gene_type:complete